MKPLFFLGALLALTACGDFDPWGKMGKKICDRYGNNCQPLCTQYGNCDAPPPPRACEMYGNCNAPENGGPPAEVKSCELYGNCE